MCSNRTYSASYGSRCYLILLLSPGTLPLMLVHAKSSKSVRVTCCGKSVAVDVYQYYYHQQTTVIIDDFLPLHPHYSPHLSPPPLSHHPTHHTTSQHHPQHHFVVVHPNTTHCKLDVPNYLNMTYHMIVGLVGYLLDLMLL